MPGAESDSSSSSSSSSSDSADEPSADNPGGDTGDTPHPSARRRLPKVENLQTNEERVDEDLKVAKFYTDAGDLNAAYLRVRDAVKYLPSDPDTHFALAYVAQKLKKREEAIAEYNNYLRLAPDGVRIKDAHKALKELQR
jgi:tetratricopeptide (TPR) repeat protein